MREKHARFLLFAFVLGACDDAVVERGTSPVMSAGEPLVDAAAGRSKSWGMNLGDPYVDPCGVMPTERAVAWDEANAVGVTPATAFGAVNGVCKATLRWTGAPAADLTSQPPSLETPLTVSVAFDQSSVRIVGDDPTLAAGGCAPQLRASATVQLASDDGLLRAEQPETATYAAATGRSSFQISVAVTGHMPGLALALGPNERASLRISLDGAASTCAGEVFLLRESMGPDAHSGSGSEGRLAEWSNSGCPFGQPSADRCGGLDASIALDHGDAGVGSVDSGLVCAHRSPQSGICDDPRFVAMCAAIATEVECASSGCRQIYGDRVDLAAGCYRGRQFVGCGLAPDGCSTVVTYGRDKDGGVWRFSDSCQASGFMMLGPQAPLAADAECP